MQGDAAISCPRELLKTARPEAKYEARCERYVREGAKKEYRRALRKSKARSTSRIFGRCGSLVGGENLCESVAVGRASDTPGCSSPCLRTDDARSSGGRGSSQLIGDAAHNDPARECRQLRGRWQKGQDHDRRRSGSFIDTHVVSALKQGGLPQSSPDGRGRRVSIRRKSESLNGGLSEAAPMPRSHG